MRLFYHIIIGSHCWFATAGKSGSPNETIKNAVISLQMTAFDSGRLGGSSDPTSNILWSEKVTRRTFNTLFDWLGPNWNFARTIHNSGQFRNVYYSLPPYNTGAGAQLAPIYYMIHFHPNPVGVCNDFSPHTPPSSTIEWKICPNANRGTGNRKTLNRTFGWRHIATDTSQPCSKSHHNRLCVMNGFHSITINRHIRPVHIY